jgi:type II secretory pathway pseudopilin PulG
VLLNRLRLTIWQSMAIVAILGVLLAFAVVPLVRQYNMRIKRIEYYRLANGIGNAVSAMKYQAPQGIPPSNWKSAVDLNLTAYVNTCHRLHPPSIENLYRLREELTPKLRGRVDIQTLAWTWDRLARSCADGKSITDELRPEFEKCFPPGTIPGQTKDEVPGDG